jgi:CO/xanthine dehydrogenase FAD-binding subunit
MLSAVELDYQLARRNGEIHDVNSDGVLSPDFERQIGFPTRPPQNLFSVGRIPAQIPGTACFGSNHYAPPHPDPLRPQGRRGNFDAFSSVSSICYYPPASPHAPADAIGSAPMGDYLQPTNLDDALGALMDRPWTILAGGTDIYPARVGKPFDEDVLDISRLDALRGITEETDHFRLGALTSWTELIDADLPPMFDGLKQAAREVGGVQIQNAGTIAGNVCNASPAADGVPPLLTLNAEIELAATRGRSVIPVEKFIINNRQTRRGHDEIITAILVPKPAQPTTSTFLKLGARRYLVISIAMVAAALERADDGTVAALRLAVGSCSAKAQRLRLLERALVGQPVSSALAEFAEPAHLSRLAPIDDVRGSADYRLDAALTLVRRALATLGSAS